MDAAPQQNDSFADALKPGTELLHGQFRIEKFLNAGGFGMTYLARDSLDRIVVIKECFPSSMCCRQKGNVMAHCCKDMTPSPWTSIWKSAAPIKRLIC